MSRLALALAALAIVLPIGLRSSGATFVASTTNPGASFSTASDFNAIAVTLTDPGTPVHGTVPLSATATSPRAIASVRFQTSPAGADAWSDLCTADTSAPYACSADSSKVADGLRDVRALATDAGGYQRSATVASRRFDNTAPTISVDDPGDAVRGTVSLQSTSSDGNGTGVVSVRYQFRPAGIGSWLDACTATTAPYSCGGDTTSIPDGLYEARAIATDGVGLSTTSPVIRGRVDNTAPTVSLANPGSPLSGSVKLTATATDPGGVASVTFERRLGGTSAWTQICTDDSSPWVCTWNTALVADARYELRATAVDAAGNASTSAVIGSRQVENASPKGVDVQAANGSGTAHKIDAGDTLTFTWSEEMSPSSILSGWTGAAKTVTLQVNNASPYDTLSVWDATNRTRLKITSRGQELQLQADRTTSGATFSATAVQAGSQVVVTVASLLTGSTITSTQAAALSWTPSAGATDLAGNACAGTVVTQSGWTAGKDF